MKILIIGGGAREHALAYKLNQSPKVTQLYSMPFNPGINEFAISFDGNIYDNQEVVSKALELGIDMVVIGPEIPLCNGLSDALANANIKAFGPNQLAATFEKSKAFTKEFLMKYQIPTAKYHRVSDYNKAIEIIKEYSYPLVIKADGLAFGKGVVICDDEKMATKVLQEMLLESIDEAYKEVVIEEFLEGFECSLLCFVDQNTIKPMVSVKDHKQIYDNDQGPNTGGMGTVSPNPYLNPEIEAKFNEELLQPILEGFKKEGISYQGVLFIGLMIKDGETKVLEFNVRFGDPETQCLMLRLETDLYDIFDSIINNKLNELEIKWKHNAVSCIVLAAQGYPNTYRKNDEITGIDKVNDALVFHAGTKVEDQKLLTNGGRVLNVVTKADTLDEAIKKGYQQLELIEFTGKTYRTDIGR